MKKIQRESTVSKKILVFTLIIIALLVTTGVFAYTTKTWPFSNNTIPTPANQSNNDDLQENATKDGDLSPNDIPTKTTDQIPVNDSISVTVDELTQSNGVIRFKATTTSSVHGGKCSLTLTNPNDKPVTRTVSASNSDSTEICGPIEIPEQEFSYLGEWTATIRYYINDTQVVATKAINIK